MIYLDLLQLCLVVVLVIDLSGIVDSLHAFMGRWLHVPAERVRIKPLDCSKCMTFWLGLGYICIVGELTLSVLLYLLFLAVMTSNIAMLCHIIIEAARGCLDKIIQRL